jgi:uncharacterized membrane protein YoaK (UPF0700 family)
MNDDQIPVVLPSFRRVPPSTPTSRGASHPAWERGMIDVAIAAAVGAALGGFFAALIGESKWWAIAWAVAGACVAVEIHRRRTRE